MTRKLRSCAICGQPVGSTASTCSQAHRQALYLRRRGVIPPAPSPARQAWEANRRLMAGQAADWLTHLAEQIPAKPADAGQLRRRILELVADLRRIFVVPGPPPVDPVSHPPTTLRDS